MALHNEILLEKEICDHLGNHGWIYEDIVAHNTYDQGTIDLQRAEVFKYLPQSNRASKQRLPLAFDLLPRAFELLY